MKISEFKKLIKECVKEIIQEDGLSEVIPGRNRQYPSSESRIFDSAVSIIAKEENEEPLSHKKFKLFKLKDKDIHVFDAPKAMTIVSSTVLVDKNKSDGKFRFRKGNVSDLQNLLRDITNVNEINGTPEYSHENFGMLESESSDKSVKYMVSYKLYDDQNRLIRVRRDVEIMGPDFTDREDEQKKYLEDKCTSMEMEIRNQANKRNNGFPSMTGKEIKHTGDVKIVGLTVNKKYKSQADLAKSPAFDSDTVKHLSRDLPPGSRVD